jgi:hypothetical protein
MPKLTIISNCAKSRQQPYKALEGPPRFQGPPIRGLPWISWVIPYKGYRIVEGSPNRTLLTDLAGRGKGDVSDSPVLAKICIQAKSANVAARQYP